MYLPSKEKTPVITAQLATRVALLGGIALALFAIVFFRLWFLQILSGDDYLTKAKNNQVREIKVEAPRGRVVDTDGKVLVNNRTAMVVQVVPQRIPTNPRLKKALISRLGKTLAMRPSTIKRYVRDQQKELPYSAVILKADVPLRTVYYLQENQRNFPGVQVERIFIRRYPHKEVGAHLFGTVGEVTRKQLEGKQFKAARSGDRVGQSGLENVYDRYLRGSNGASRIQVDANGRPKGELAVKKPKSGKQLRLSIDMQTQMAAEAAINTGVHAFGRGSAAVAMDPKSGEVIALASYPNFDPNIFSKPVKESTYKQLTNPQNGAPLANRATQGLYPTGSTFKLISAVAALEGGLITPASVVYDGGSIRVGGITFENAGGASYGAVNVVSALKVSSDVFFYTMGLRSNRQGKNVLQTWAKRLGLGRKTGIDLPAEVDGLIPTPKWRNRLYKKKMTDRPWSDGDAVNLAVGQGDLQANPLQMAVAYSAVANGGKVVTPHIGRSIEDGSGRLIQELKGAERRKLPIGSSTREAIMKGLRGAASEPGGTSTSVFKGFKVPVAGKTGTAERPGQGDQSWYVAMAPYPDPEIVVAVTIEGGGFGADAAAPAARKILSAYFRIKDKQKIDKGKVRD